MSTAVKQESCGKLWWFNRTCFVFWMLHFYNLNKVHLLAEKNGAWMCWVCRALVLELSKSWRIFIKKQRKKFVVLTVQPNQSTNLRNAHPCTCLYLCWILCFKPNHSGTKLVFNKDCSILFYFILFFTWKYLRGFFCVC